jgi:hypothetical protein
MKLVQPRSINAWRAIFILAMTVSNLGCSQTPVETAPLSPRLPSSDSKTMPNITTNRIMARLDGLTGDSDPRLLALNNRIVQLGMTVLSMGTAVSTTTPSAVGLNSPNYSAFIVVAIDTSKTDLKIALVQFRALEAFTYVEADQLLQKRQ